MRNSTKIISAGCTAVALLIAVGVAWLYIQINQGFQRNPPDSALPMLVRNLPTQTVEIEPAFQRRVRAKFPDGIASAALAVDLRRKGFHVREDRKGSIEIASLEQHGFPCAADWVIYWSPDAQGRAQKIGAHVNNGCL